MKTLAMTIVMCAAVGMGGCSKRPLYYRQEVEGGYTYWREYKPTTKHGLCANMYGNKAGTKWEVDHPWGVNPENHMSAGDESRFFESKNAAESWAESVCPTGFVPQGVGR